MRVQLVCFIASVIKEPRRLEFFKQLLKSIQDQELPLDGLFISSYIDPSLQTDIQELLRGISSTGTKVHILKQKRPKRQFVQIKELSDRVDKVFPCPQNTESFILFSDDDDLWHPTRTKHYYRISTDADSTLFPMLSAICMRESTEIDKFEYPTVCSNHPEATCAADVDRLIECGCLSFKFNQSDLYEYHEYAVRRYVLREFLTENAWIVNNNRFADMRFRYFIATYKVGIMRTAHYIPDQWLYYYRHSNWDYPAVTHPFADGKVSENVVDYLVEMEECPDTNCGFQKSTETLMTRLNLDETSRLAFRLYLDMKLQIRRNQKKHE